MGHYHSVSSAVFARIVRQRAVAVAARHAGRQAAHDAAASARAAQKREERRHARAPRGQTQVIGHREDGSPIYRSVPSFRARPYTFRARPYTAPEHRKERPEPTIEAVNGWRYNVRPTADRIAAALKAEAPQVRGVRQLEGVCPGEPFCSCGDGVIALPRDPKRAARKVRMAAKRRRGW